MNDVETSHDLSAPDLSSVAVEPAFDSPPPAVLAPATGSSPPALAAGEDPVAGALADLIAAAESETPLALAVLGPAGAGKTSALRSILVLAEARAQGAGTELTPVRVDVAEIVAEPEVGLAAAVFKTLTKTAAHDNRLARAAREAEASLRDVHAVARASADRLSEMRLLLETERRSLETVSGKRARLVDSIAFESPGTRFDSYARAYRATIESRMRAFGFDSDPIAVWKEFARDVAERGSVRKFMFTLRALWGYRGQFRWLAGTALFAVAAWASGLVGADRAQLIGRLESTSGTQAAAVGGWIDAHASLFAVAQTAFVVLACACLVIGVGRALRFLGPVLRGASLLQNDVVARRRELDGQLAHQSRRVDVLSREVETQALRAESDEKRAAGVRGSVSRSEEMRGFYGRDEDSAGARLRFARDFMTEFERLTAAEGGTAHRLVVALDGFENLEPAQAASVLKAVRLLKRPGVAMIFALDPEQIRAAFGAAAADWAGRLFDVFVRLASDDSLAHRAGSAGAAPGPVSSAESQLVHMLAAFAGPTPRQRKTFVDAYRFARRATGASGAEAGALALSLLDSTQAFAAEPGARDSALRALTAAGFAVAADDVARFAPLAARLRPV